MLPLPRSYVQGLVAQQLYELVPPYLCHLRQQLREQLFVQLADALTDCASEEQQRAVCTLAADWFGIWFHRQTDMEEAGYEEGGCLGCWG